jgi:hypothetical protein
MKKVRLLNHKNLTSPCRSRRPAKPVDRGSFKKPGYCRNYSTGMKFLNLN